MSGSEPQNTSSIRGILGSAGKVEIIIIAILLLGFLLWAVSKCSSSERQPNRTTEQPDNENSPAAMDDVPTSPELNFDDVATSPNPNPNPPPTTPTTEANPTVVTTTRTKLYVTIQGGMNLRSQPSTESDILARLKYKEGVFFMDEVSEFRETLRDEQGEEVNDRWVKVKSEGGRTGWVFGAYVDYLKPN